MHPLEVVCVGVRHELLKVVGVEGGALLAQAERVEVEEEHHERGYGRHGEGEAARDVHLVGFGRQAVHDGQQYAFVAHHYGCLTAGTVAVVLEEPVGREARLRILRGRGDEAYAFGSAHVGVDVGVGVVELVGEVGDVKVLGW